jgi:hypothetical protein
MKDGNTSDIDYNYEEEEQIKLMYKAVYQLNDIEKISFVSRGQGLPRDSRNIRD